MSRARWAAGRVARARRLTLALALALATWVVASGDSARADAAQVTVVTPGGAQHSISLDALAGQEDIRDRTYALRSATGTTTLTVTGFSLATILAAADVDPYGFSYLELQRPAGGSVLLSRDQALDPYTSSDGPPVVYATGGGTGFLRPSAGDDDLNASDCFEAPQGLTIALRKDSPLRVRAEASTVQVAAGKPVAFTAVVEAAGAGEPLSYSWYFDDGHSASGPSARHSFAKRGSYDVVVGVTTPGDRAGVSAVVTIQVGAPLSGPDRKGGGRNRDADAPDHGAATGTRGAVPPGPASGPHSGRVQPSPSSHPRRRDRRRQPSGQAVDGQRVSGLLLASTAEVSADPGVVRAARTGALDDAGGSPGLPDAAVGLLTTIGLLGAGALIEVRR